MSPGKFTTYAGEVPGLDLTKWLEVCDELSRTDEYIKQRFDTADLILVNGGNCMHHNIPRSLALMALMKTAAELGKKVMLLNATVQMMDVELLKIVLPLLSLIHVRDRQSQMYLEEIGIESVYTTDLAFIGYGKQKETDIRYLNSEEYVLVTGGVAIDERSLESIINTVNDFGMRPVYFCVCDAGEEDLVTPVCEKLDVPVISVKEMAFEQLASFLAQFRYAISGRHYINIFLIRAGVPFVALPSDTWIADDVSALLDNLIPVVSNHDELIVALRKIESDFDRIKLQCARALENAELSIMSLHEELVKYSNSKPEVTSHSLST